MTQLSRLTKLGFAPEVTPGMYVPPTTAIPFTKADFEDVIAQIKDESFRANDTNLQDMYPGPTHATWSIDIEAYPDLTGHFLRGIIGPDTVTPGISTTLSGTGTAIGANSIQTQASIPAGSTVQVGTGAGAEFATTGTPTGSTAPFTIPIVTPAGGLTKVHAASETVMTATVHTFKQDPTQAKRTFSITVDDTTNNPLGYNAATMSDLGIKIDPKGAVTLSAKMLSMPGAAQPTFVPSFQKQPPLLGWQWRFTNAGAASTRGLSLDYTIKRAVEAVHSAVGVQGPREIFQGSLDADFSYKAIFENQIDLNMYLNYAKGAVLSTIAQPPSLGGCTLQLTMSQAGVHKGKRDIGNGYIQASFSGSGTYNTTDGGAVSAVLTNFVPAVY